MDFNEKELQIAKKHYWNNPEIKDNIHLSSNFALYRYIRHTDTIEKYLKKGKKILDWGSGMGQMSLLLKNRKYNVVAFDAIKKLKIYDKMGVKYIKGGDKLPFADASFDAVLSCGVLEHVKDDVYSLEEIYRILKPNGILFIFNLPNKYSYSEYIGRHSKLGGHEHIYSKAEIKGKLAKTGFALEHFGRSHMLPVHVLRMQLFSIYNFYNKHYKLATKLDEALESVPGVNFIANEWEIVARKR